MVDNEVINLPIDDLSLNKRLKRELVSLKVTCLKEAFEWDYLDASSKLSFKSFNEYSHLLDIYEANRDLLASEVLSSKDDNSYSNNVVSDNEAFHTEVNSRYEATCIEDTDRYTKRIDCVDSYGYSTGKYLYLSSAVQRDELLDFELRATKSFEGILAHSESAIVAETFDDFEIDFNQFQHCFSDFIKFYIQTANDKELLELIEAFVPYSYLIYVSDSTRRNFDGRNLWGNVALELGVDECSLFFSECKKLFQKLLMRVGLQVYSSDMSPNQFRDTALLHSGLSKAIWCDIWQDTLLPLAQDNRTVVYDGYDLIHFAVDQQSSFRIDKKTTRKILRDAPDARMVNLLEAAYKTALQVKEAQSNKDGLSAFLSSSGLSVDAMDALKTTVSENSSSNKSYSIKKDNLYWIKDPILYLDINDVQHPIKLKWKAQRLSKRFSNKHMDVYVNGLFVSRIKPKRDVDGFFMPETVLSIDAYEQYSVEMQIVESKDSVESIIASKVTSFTDERDGIFEFVSYNSGPYMYSNRSVKSYRSLKRAYILYPKYDIEARCGFQLIRNLELNDGYGLRAYAVEDGANACVVDSTDMSVVGQIQQTFKYKFDDKYKIGQYGKYNVFGYSSLSSSGSFNERLPLIKIFAQQNIQLDKSLTIECVCDGRKISIKHCSHQVYSETDDIVSSFLMLDLPLSNIPFVVKNGSLKVVINNTGEILFDYKFKVLPINSLHLVNLEYVGNEFIGTYAFEASNNCLVRCGGYNWDCKTGDICQFRTLLSSELIPITIRHWNEQEELVISAELYLAGINITLPNVLNNKDAVYLDEVFGSSESDWMFTIGSNAQMKQECMARGVYTALDYAPVAVRFNADSPFVLKKPINKLVDLGGCVQSISDFYKPLPLSISVTFGTTKTQRPPKGAYLNLEFIKSGYDLGSISSVYLSDRCGIVFNKPTKLNLLYRYIVQNIKNTCSWHDIKSDQTYLELPANLKKYLYTDDTNIILEIGVPDDFDFEGKPISNLIKRIQFGRGC